MVITNDVNLPEFSALNVQEVNLSTATLISAAPYLGKCCELINNDFMLCRQETRDPRDCIELGKSVTSCTLQFFRKVKNSCLKEFNQYANCIDKSSGDFSYTYCRKTQAIFDDCMKNKLKMDRPDFGYFCRARVHSSKLAPPLPEACPCTSSVPDPTPSLPDCKPRPKPRFGSRYYWMTE